jgi:alanyl-tRNA synthetase
MVSTERLYYTDCYLREFDAQIVESSESGTRLYLDRTAFYPASGGQPQDLGLLGGRAVVDVVDEDGRIAHLLAEPLLSGAVHAEIDWRRRYDHMQQHTGQHLLSAVFIDLFEYETLSFHLGSDSSTIELAARQVSDAEIARAEESANEMVRRALPVAIRFERADVVEGLRKPSTRSGTLRIIEIEGVDRSACGGTHVRSTAELGPIQIRGTERVRGNVRVEFVCGIRALERAKRDYAAVADLVRQTAVSVEQLPAHFASLRQRLVEAEKQAQKLGLELARTEGATLHAASPPLGDGLRRLLLRVASVDETVRTKTQAFAAGGAAIALAIGADGSVLIASSPDSGVNAGFCLKQVLSQSGGRGGGSAILAQGRLPDENAAKKLRKDLGFGEGS